MCGIVGFINIDNKYITQSLSRIAHRGPDNQGTYINKNVTLGHTRLSIQDLSSNGNQPMSLDNGNLTIVFNGEIYNHMELRQELPATIDYKSTSDTETLLYGYKYWGISVLDKLNGIFSFTIYDKSKNELIIVRDHFGVKPLYYYLKDNIFIFSSELKAMTFIDGLDRSLDYTALANYIYYLWSPGEKTPFLNFYKLLPGHYIRINTGNLEDCEICKYYDIPFDGKYLNHTESELIDELDEKLTKAIQRQLLSDVPVGFFLSGGLDSSLIVAIAQKINPNNKIKCFTIDTITDTQAEGLEDDLPYAKKVAEYLGVDLEIISGYSENMEFFDKMIYSMDEPQADIAPINVLNISKRSRELGYYVLLGGTGGDDLFSGYRRHVLVEINKKLKLVPHGVKKIIAYGSKHLKYKNPTFRRIKKLLSIYQYKSDEEKMASLFGWLNIDKVKKLFREEIDFDPTKFLTNSLLNIKNEKQLLNKLLYWDLKYFLVDHNLNYTDKMSMAHGVEVRVPFLDKNLVEFGTMLPVSLKMKGVNTKYLLRKVAERYLPSEVIYRSKTGFGVPVRDWVDNDLKSKITDCTMNNDSMFSKIFDLEAVNNLVNENQTKKIDAAYPILALIAINSWLNQFYDNN